MTDEPSCYSCGGDAGYGDGYEDGFVEGRKKERERMETLLNDAPSVDVDSRNYREMGSGVKRLQNIETREYIDKEWVRRRLDLDGEGNE